MTVLVVGAAGLIGSALVARLRSEGARVEGVDVRAADTVDQLASADEVGARLCAGDILVLAWGDPQHTAGAEIVAAEVAVNARLIAACERLGCGLLYCSSMWIEHASERPYAVGKRAIEEVLRRTPIPSAVDRIGSCAPSASPLLGTWVDAVRITPEALAERLWRRLQALELTLSGAADLRPS